MLSKYKKAAIIPITALMLSGGCINPNRIDLTIRHSADMRRKDEYGLHPPESTEYMRTEKSYFEAREEYKKKRERMKSREN